ncbi:MAG TPA: vanadium-dependent haloperoxidase [Verrucomicrobiae bacterium]|nr:vanadium-dependent haloperoxidase [Verrucomicrobiae bacterium]
MTSIAARILFATTVLAFGIPLGGSAARADVVTEWNVIALNATTIPPNSVLQSRTIAIVHAAIYDAANAVERKGGAYAVDLKAAPGTSLDAAVAAAAHGALVRLVPAQRPALDTALNATLAKVTEGPGKTDGVTIGAQVAERMVALRSSDGSESKVAFTPTTGPGRYQLTSGPAILTQWGDVKPFVLRSIEGLEFKGAPEITSAEFARDFDEVKSLGARNSTTRTADQTAAAIFWVVQTGVPWHAAARAASAAKGLSISENARLFALLALATADSQIVAMKEKYSRPHWRPLTAIRDATAGINVPGLTGNPLWEPLLVTPPHPDYPSAHAVFSGAAETVLRSFFGSDTVNVSVTFPGTFGITRTYTSFSAITEEVDNARVWGGIHFRSADIDGSEVGRKIGAVVMREFPKPATN